MKKSQVTVLLFALAGLGTGMLTTTAVFTQYSGLINVGAEVWGGKGYIVIDGRTIDRPALPPTK